MKLHMGCGDVQMEGYLGVDICEPPPWATPENFLQYDLRRGWPWEDSSVDEIIAHDTFEHIEGPGFTGNAGMIWTFNESWRILRPGCVLDLVVPCWPGIAPFCDPTHKVVYTSDSRYYFDGRWNNPQGERGRLGPAYGIEAVFRTLPESRSGVDWKPINYAPGTGRHKLFLRLAAIK